MSNIKFNNKLNKKSLFSRVKLVIKRLALIFFINSCTIRYIFQSKSLQIHCGQNIWITVQDYNNAKAASGTDAVFVKNVAVDIFTRDVSKNSSVTGKLSNRTKGPAKPKLDPVKMLAVRGKKFYIY